MTFPKISKMSDHDQRLKLLVKEFLHEFFLLFFPEWSEVFDFTEVTWLDQEVFPDPLDGSRQVADLVAQLTTKMPIRLSDNDEPTLWTVLIHIELEARDSVKVLRRRMHCYYTGFRGRHDVPVLPIALYLNVGLDGVGIETYSEQFDVVDGPKHETLTFRYLYVGLPALDAEEYLDSGNPLAAGFVSLMKTPKGELVRLKATALRKIADSHQNDYRKFLLSECVLAYKPLGEVEQVELNELLETPQFQEARKMAVTFFERGVEEGRQEGRQEGLRDAVKIFLEGRFGALPKRVVKIIDAWPESGLRPLMQSIHGLESLTDLKTHRRQK